MIYLTFCLLIHFFFLNKETNKYDCSCKAVHGYNVRTGNTG